MNSFQSYLDELISADDDLRECWDMIVLNFFKDDDWLVEHLRDHVEIHYIDGFVKSPKGVMLGATRLKSDGPLQVIISSVLDNEEFSDKDFYNVLAHEMCHCASYFTEGDLDGTHTKGWKKFADKLNTTGKFKITPVSDEKGKINEQLYKNLNRPYFKGVPYDSLDYSKSRYNAVYFTNSFAYAVMYSYKGDNEHGSVFEYRLQKGINIFNAHSKTDVQKLKLEIFKALKNKNSLFYKLFHNYYRFDDDFFQKLGKYDWSYFLDGDKNRDCFVEVAKKAGFEGYFNFEWNKKANEEAGVNFGFELNDIPTIGIFDASKMKVVRKIKYDEYFEFPDFIDAYNKDKEKLSQYVSNLYNNDVEDYKDLAYKYASENLLFLDIDEVSDIISDPEDLDESYQNTKKAKLFNECIKYGKSKNTYNGLTCYLSSDYLLKWRRYEGE